MTDAPFTETHRELLEEMLVGSDEAEAIDAALLYIKWLEGEIGRLTTLAQACGKTECVPLAELNAAKAEIDRLTKENEDMRKHLDGLYQIAHPEDLEAR